MTHELMQNELLRYLDATMVSRQQRLAFVTASIPRIVVCRLHRRISDDCISVNAARGARVADHSGDQRVYPGDHDIPDYAMDRPIKGAVSVCPDSFQSVYDLVMRWEEPA